MLLRECGLGLIKKIMIREYFIIHSSLRLKGICKETNFNDHGMYVSTYIQYIYGILQGCIMVKTIKRNKKITFRMLEYLETEVRKKSDKCNEDVICALVQ